MRSSRSHAHISRRPALCGSADSRNTQPAVRRLGYDELGAGPRARGQAGDQRGGRQAAAVFQL